MAELARPPAVAARRHQGGARQAIREQQIIWRTLRNTEGCAVYVMIHQRAAVQIQQHDERSGYRPKSLKLILGPDVDVDGPARKSGAEPAGYSCRYHRPRVYYDGQEAVDAAANCGLIHAKFRTSERCSGGPCKRNIDRTRPTPRDNSNNKFHGDDNSGQYGGSRLVECRMTLTRQVCRQRSYPPGELDNW